MSLEEALQIAKERNLDLIQVSEKAVPVICKIMDYGKYQYLLQKKEKQAKLKRADVIKGVRLRFNISFHDLETKAKLAEKFLEKGDKVKVELLLKGREKAFSELAKEKINHFLEILGRAIPFKIERELKKEPRGLTMIIAKQ